MISIIINIIIIVIISIIISISNTQQQHYDIMLWPHTATKLLFHYKRLRQSNIIGFLGLCDVAVLSQAHY